MSDISDILCSYSAPLETIAEEKELNSLYPTPDSSSYAASLPDLSQPRMQPFIHLANSNTTNCFRDTIKLSSLPRIQTSRSNDNGSNISPNINSNFFKQDDYPDDRYIWPPASPTSSSSICLSPNIGSSLTRINSPVCDSASEIFSKKLREVSKIISVKEDPELQLVGKAIRHVYTPSWISALDQKEDFTTSKKINQINDNNKVGSQIRLKRSKSWTKSRTVDMNRDLHQMPSPKEQECIIFSGPLEKRNRYGHYQRRIVRFDGILLLCLSETRYRLLKLTPYI